MAIVRDEGGWFYAAMQRLKVVGYGAIRRTSAASRRCAPLYGFFANLRNKKEPTRILLVMDGDHAAVGQVMDAIFLPKPAGIHLLHFTRFRLGHLGEVLGIDIRPGERVDHRAFIQEVNNLGEGTFGRRDYPIARAVAMASLEPHAEHARDGARAVAKVRAMLKMRRLELP